MELEEAISLLGLEPGEGLGRLRQRYHEQMHQCHPDVCGDEKGTSRAQLLNEAYTLVKKNWPLPGQTSMGGKWSERINPGAYAGRRIRMLDAPFGKELLLDVAEGKYLWEPEQEPFSLFLGSVGELASRLGEEAGAEEWQKGKILHLLLQQYIHPLYVLEDMETMGQIERVEDTYVLRCHVDRDAYPPVFDEGKRFPVAVRSLRLFGEDEDGDLLGQISFQEDALYYVVTPLLLQGVASGWLSLKAEAASPAKARRGRRSAVKSYREGQFLLTLTGKAWEDPTKKIGQELSRILHQEGQP